ncbi:MAG: hypothetical protein R2824_11020 [Saprospiraceae bacterium]|nr:hypothetical protein [Lewinella sp.]
MKRLIELVDIVTRNKVKSIEIIGNDLDSETKLMQFYQGIYSGKLTNDQEAFEFLYPGMDSRNAYYKLKHVLNERLRNTLFFIDIKKNKFSNIKRAYLECQKLICNFNLLLTKGARENALHLGEKALKTAEEYEFTQEILFLSRSLAANYASVFGDRRKYQEYADKVHYYHQVFTAETLVEMFYMDLLSLYVRDKSTKTYVYELAQDYLRQLQVYRNKVSSCNFIFGLNMLHTIQYMSINDFREAYRITGKALDQIKNYSFFNARAFTTLSFQHIACCIQLRKHQEGVLTIHALEQIMEKGTFNWYKTQELHFTLSLHTRKYQEAHAIFKQVTLRPDFKNLVQNIRETWTIYGAWVYLLKASGKIKEERRKGSDKFRIQKYLNEVPTFSRDKRGLNVPILISQIFLLLQQRKYDQLLDLFEAIEKYKDRYLDHEHNFRSNVFIRMLLQVPKSCFKVVRVRENTECLRQRLQEVTLEIANQSHDLEIFPYEDAWGLLLDLLEQ